MDWIGTVHVRPQPGTNALGPGRVGAYVVVLARASSPDEFRRLVRIEFDSENLAVVEFNDIDTYATYLSEGRISDESAELRNQLSPAQPVQYRTFDCYSMDDA